MNQVPEKHILIRNQIQMYFFLLMLYKTSTCKIFWQCAVVFIHKFYSFLIRQFLFLSFYQFASRMVMIFYRISNVFFICPADGLLQYSKSVWSKVGTLTVYMLISCILMPENCFRSGKGCTMYAIFYGSQFFLILYLIKISECPSIYYLKTKINPKQ
jgi:hypothetical protein